MESFNNGCRVVCRCLRNDRPFHLCVLGLLIGSAWIGGAYGLKIAADIDFGWAIALVLDGMVCFCSMVIAIIMLFKYRQSNDIDYLGLALMGVRKSVV